MYTEENYNELMKFIRGSFGPRVGIISGLDNTENMALMKRAMDELTTEGKSYIFIDCDTNTTWDDVADRLDELRWNEDENKPKYVFINEVSRVPYFVHRAAILADLFAHTQKIVMTGTASLVFYLASLSELYDRARFIKLPAPEMEVESDCFKTAVIDNILFSLNIAHTYRYHRIDFPIVELYSEEEITEAIKIIATSERPYEINMKSSYINNIEDYLHFLGLKEYVGWLSRWMK